jgi:UDP-N-acetylglucosamine 1-carboxyvinyltransferase
MEKIVIEGGRRLSGSVSISGAKNAALPIMVASLLTKDETVLNNVPRLGDVQIMAEILKSIGVKIEFVGNTLRLKADNIMADALSHNLLTQDIRYSIHLIGALLPQFNRIRITLPGGCKIGTRRIDSHILGLTKLGARINVSNEHIEATADEFYGSSIKLEYPSVGATENILIAASVAKGTTTIENPAKEPEIVDLANFLGSMGAEIDGAGTNTIKISGASRLRGRHHTIIPDRIETGTYLVAAAATHSDVLVSDTDPSLLTSVTSKLREIGVEIEEGSRDIYVRVNPSDKLHPADIITAVYPGFPTDMQPIMAPLLSMAEGESSIKETIFDHRFNHAPELVKMGARIRAEGDTLLIRGMSCLRGAEVEASDIRSGGALVVAGMVAKGKTVINGADQIYRGYENIIDKFCKIGATCSVLP